MNQSDRDRLVEYLHSIARPDADLSSVEDDDNLIDAGIVDSFAFVQIIQYLEQDLGVPIHQHLISPEDLATIGGILETVRMAKQ